MYIDDLIRAIWSAAHTDGIGGEIFQIATNRETTVTELTDTLLHVLSQMGYSNIQVRHAAPRTGDVRRNFSDTSKAASMLGWKTDIDIENGLRRTVGWFVNI